MSSVLDRLTRRGRLVLALGVGGVVVSLVLGQRDLLRVGILLVALPLLAALLVSRTRYRLASARGLRPLSTDPPIAQSGRSTRICSRNALQKRVVVQEPLPGVYSKAKIRMSSPENRRQIHKPQGLRPFRKFIRKGLFRINE